MGKRLQHGDILVNLMPATWWADHKGNRTDVPEGWQAAWYSDRLPFIGWHFVDGPIKAAQGGRFHTEDEARAAALEAVAKEGK